MQQPAMLLRSETFSSEEGNTIDTIANRTRMFHKIIVAVIVISFFVMAGLLLAYVPELPLLWMGVILLFTAACDAWFISFLKKGSRKFSADQQQRVKEIYQAHIKKKWRNDTAVLMLQATKGEVHIVSKEQFDSFEEGDPCEVSMAQQSGYVFSIKKL